MAISCEKELHRYTISLHDFEKAKKYVSAAEKHDLSSIEYGSLLSMSIISYFRPFTTNEKSKSAGAKSRLSIDDFGNLSRCQKQIHEKCKELRNKVFAHSEFSWNPTKISKKTNVIHSRTFSILNEDFDIDLFKRLLEFVIEACHKRRADYVRTADRSA